MIRHRRCRRPGVLLMEMMVVILILAAVMGLLGGILWSAFRIHAAAMAALAEMQSEISLADRFRADVAAAHETPDLAGDFQASPLCIILRSDNDAIIVYRQQEQAVQRILLGAGEPTIESYRVGGSDVRCQFHRTGRLLAMSLAGSGRGALTIAAALGGTAP